MADWHLITCEYPPTMGGVSDYTFTMASALGAHRPVHVWCPEAEDAAPPAGNVTVHAVPGLFSWSGLQQLSAALDRTPGPRELFVQWVPQGFGYRSLNVPFSWWLAQRARTGDRVQLMVHEPFLDWSKKPSHTVAAATHRLMLAIAGRAATRVWVSTVSWMDRLRPFVPRGIPIEWLPLPSSLPGPDHIAAREPGEQLTVGHFGLYSPLVTPLLQRALEIVLDRTDAHILLIGRRGERFRAKWLESRTDVEHRVHATGAIDRKQLAARLQGCDLMLQPYPDGVTTRRTSTITLLSLGLPVVSNTGHLSEPFWPGTSAVALAGGPDGRLIGEAAVGLLASATKRTALGSRARSLYEDRFAVRHAVAKLNAASPWPQHDAA